MKYFYRYLLILICCLSLSGCTSKSVDNNEVAIESSDWKNIGFVSSDEVLEEPELWIQEYLPCNHNGVVYDDEKEEIFYIIEAGVCEETFYRLYTIVEPPIGLAKRWILEKYNLNTLQSVFEEITYQQLGIEEGAYVMDMAVIGKDSYVFQVVTYGQNEYGQGQQTSNCFIYTDLKSKLEKIDLLLTYKEIGIVQKQEENIVLKGECICDQKGNSYIRNAVDENEYSELFVLDRNGNVEMEYNGTKQEQIQPPFKTEDGYLIFPIYNIQENYTHFIWIDVENNLINDLGNVIGERISQVYCMQGNNIYYESEKGVIKWDTLTGKRKLIFAFKENGISNTYETFLLFKDGKQPIMRMYTTSIESNEDWIVQLSTEKKEAGEAVKISALVENEKVILGVAVAERKNPQYRYKYENSTFLQNEDFRDKVMADITEGRGPDILYVSREDMELLSKQGALVDLRTLISESTLKKILPGAIDLGTVNNILAGIPIGVSAETLNVSQEICDKNAWTLDDVIDLMENGKLDKRLYHGESFFAPSGALMLLLNNNLESSFLIDWNSRESHFEDERFLRLLECLKMGEKDSAEPADTAINSVSNMMVILKLDQISDISEFYGTKFSEGGKLIGMPTEQKNGNFVNSEGFFVVNKNTLNPEAISNFLECVLGDEIQFDRNSTCIPVCRMSVDEINYIENTDEAYAYGEKLVVFDDGTTSLHETINFLEKCIAKPKEYRTIENIIFEEIQGYFIGDKDAITTAKIINNRVQLYLEESY